MKSHRITGGGGVALHVVETGVATGRPILFIHGFSQCWLAWSRQFDADLAADHRLVALDLRGHGLSDKPREGYDDSRLWADDVHAVMQTLGLDGALLCGWSYGPLVILDYIRHYGEDGLGGIHFVGGISKLGSEQALSVLTPAFLELVPGFFATDAEQSTRSLEALLRICFVQEPSSAELYTMLGYNVSVPPARAAGAAVPFSRQRRTAVGNSQTRVAHSRRAGRGRQADHRRPAQGAHATRASSRRAVGRACAILG